MRRLLVWLPLVAFGLLFAVVAAGLLKPADPAVRSAMVGKPLPRFALPAMVPGKPGVTSARFADGVPHLLNVFASWCLPCIAEAPQLDRLRTMGVPVTGVAVRDTPAAIAAFLRANGDPFAAIGDDRDSRLQLALGSSGVPESYVIDGEGRIVLQHIGEIREDDVAAIAAAVRSAR